VALSVRPRPSTRTRLHALLLAGVAAVVFFASCLNPQPDDFPQSDRGTVPNERMATQAPADVEAAPGATSTAPVPLAPPAADADEAPPASASAPDDAFAGAPDVDADAGAPADAGPPDAAPVVAQ